MGCAEHGASRRRRDVDHRQLRPVLNLTYWGTAQAQTWMPVSPAVWIRSKRTVYDLHARARLDHRQAGGVLLARAGRSPGSRRRVQRVLVDSGGQNLVFTAGKDGILWSSIARRVSTSVTRRRSFQNVCGSSIQDREPRYRRTSSTRKSVSGSTVAPAPKRAQLAGDDPSSIDEHAVSFTQPELPVIRAQRIEQKEGGGSRWRRRPPVLEMPWYQRQYRQARAFDVNSMKELWSIERGPIPTS